MLSGGETPAASPRDPFSHKRAEGPHVENKKSGFAICLLSSVRGIKIFPSGRETCAKARSRWSTSATQAATCSPLEVAPPPPAAGVRGQEGEGGRRWRGQ